ncbi:unnamed protein product, partial [Didymodactylos carnosus]
MLPLKQLACYGRKVVFYDQIGCGKSSVSNNTEINTSHLLTTEYYVEELQSVILHLKFDKVYILGHSWGGIVAQYYALKHPNELKGLILASTLSDAQL